PASPSSPAWENSPAQDETLPASRAETRSAAQTRPATRCDTAHRRRETPTPKSAPTRTALHASQPAICGAPRSASPPAIRSGTLLQRLRQGPPAGSSARDHTAPPAAPPVRQHHTEVPPIAARTGSWEPSSSISGGAHAQVLSRQSLCLHHHAAHSFADLRSRRRNRNRTRPLAAVQGAARRGLSSGNG